MRISIGPGSEYCPTTTGSSCARWKEPSTCGRQSMLSHIRLPYHLLIVHGHWTNACLFYTLFITKSTYVVCLPYHLWIVFGQTPSIPFSRILGRQHPALLSDRSRKPLRVERTSPLTHSGATWRYLCNNSKFWNIGKCYTFQSIKYLELLYISKYFFKQCLVQEQLKAGKGPSDDQVKTFWTWSNPLQISNLPISGASLGGSEGWQRLGEALHRIRN